MRRILAILIAGGLPLLGADEPKPLPKDIPALQKLAQQGDARAQNELGVRFYFGTGVDKNPVTAVKWFTAAAKGGVAKAQYNLGILCEKGEGVLEDDAEAVKWFTKAAVQGFPLAQADLGAMYLIGKGVKQDFLRAYAWMNLAEFNGNAKAKRAKALLARRMTPPQVNAAQELSRKLAKDNPKAVKNKK